MLFDHTGFVPCVPNGAIKYMYTYHSVEDIIYMLLFLVSCCAMFDLWPFGHSAFNLDPIYFDCYFFIRFPLQFVLKKV